MPAVWVEHYQCQFIVLPLTWTMPCLATKGGCPPYVHRNEARDLSTKSGRRSVQTWQMNQDWNPWIERTSNSGPPTTKMKQALISELHTGFWSRGEETFWCMGFLSQQLLTSKQVIALYQTPWSCEEMRIWVKIRDKGRCVFTLLVFSSRHKWDGMWMCNLLHKVGWHPESEEKLPSTPKCCVT